MNNITQIRPLMYEEGDSAEQWGLSNGSYHSVGIHHEPQSLRQMGVGDENLCVEAK